ncbi:Diacylglycerol acyltransferase/mycolyltransferase Ag85A precursor [Corynebacterium faecale]|uniref:alpha/beta hydrolase n=1 Tax=Corynebacterium faecale TaxID=1758466 RepID=UPI0025B59301|nr:alpha/beta hydrolase family protein [Corynebacterium faecale]WJY91664.1 Diacylglycerol acyltransferase/mycolyltransferase Ag85A precursor [Corynebacterium faecale]
MRTVSSRIITAAVATTVALGTLAAGTPVSWAYDYGMDPSIRYNPIDDIKDRPEGLSDIPLVGRQLTGWGSSDASASSGIVTSTRTQDFDPRYPNGKAHLPKAEIDMDPEVLARLARFANVDGDRIRQINAYSPSMERWIPLVWIVPEDNSVPRPTLYALGGGDGGQGSANWITKTDMQELMSQNNVNVIMPMLGSFSFYADWVEENESLGGKQQWETFLTHELPEPLESAIGADGQRSLIGMSMSGGSVLNIASHMPNYYSSVGSLSGCAETNSWMGRRGMAATIYSGNATPTQIFGAVDSDYSRYNDPVINAHKLGEQDNLYVFAASGVWSDVDVEGDNAPEDEDGLKNRITVGFRIEALSNSCTHNLKAATDFQGIDTINYDFRPTGTHAWDYWNEALHRFFPLMMQGFGLDGGPIPEYNPNGLNPNGLSSALSSGSSTGEVLGAVGGSSESSDNTSSARDFVAGSSALNSLSSATGSVYNN